MSNYLVLSKDLLEHFARRAADYDRENGFFFENFEELRQANYLLAAVPKEFGGLGLTLAETCQEQRRLAPTALGLNMHLTATGIAADLWHKGDNSQVWMLEEAARGAVFAYAYSESGSDLEVIYSLSKAERVDGGYRFFWAPTFWLADPGLDMVQYVWGRSSQPGRPANSSCRDAARHVGLPYRRDLRHAGDAGDSEPRHDPRRRVCSGSPCAQCEKARLCRCQRLRRDDIRPVRADDRQHLYRLGGARDLTIERIKKKRRSPI
jgi:hypothetical protein